MEQARPPRRLGWPCGQLRYLDRNVSPTAPIFESDMQTFAYCTDGLAMTKRLPDPMDHTPVLLQRIGRLGPRGDKQRVKQGAPLSLEMVVRHDESRPCRTGDFTPPGPDDERGGSSQFQRSPQSFDNISLKTIRDKDRNPPRLDQRLFRGEIHLRYPDGLLPVALSFRLWGLVAPDVDRDRLGQPVVDLVKLGNGIIVNERIVAVAELERNGIDQMLLLHRREGVVEELCLVKVLLELRGAGTEFHAMYVLSVLVVPALVCVSGWDRIEPIRPVVHTLGDPGLVLAVSDMIEHRTDGLVYRELRRAR